VIRKILDEQPMKITSRSRNPIFDAVESNIAIRFFSKQPIEEARIEKILESARLCQSGKNLQPWYFILIKDPSALETLASYMKGDVDEVELKNAPIAIAVISDPTSEFHIVDAGRAIQNMTLVAWEMGIGSTMISGLEPPNRESCRDEIKRFLRVPENLKLVDLVIFGYRKSKARIKHKDRKPLADIAFLERFGAPTPFARSK
jgi:nitroreductase